ncbi:dolichyl-phosphate beta-glucosyltransferase-like [Physella acuta]|uniref:dolichyl-phosphate beta-glucosyltransferase-like n=1 Tax=Physella acuta TaxID=109671 RepID=UPI0027DAC8EC|nr:dolichyl-phosphate beta-glucosyltransferase-like [Physella acuta]
MLPAIHSVVAFLIVAVIIVIFLFLLYTYMTAKPYPNLGRHDSEKFYYDPKSKSKRLFPDYASSPTVELSVIVPAYNEEKRLPIMMEEAMGYLEKRQAQDPTFSYEVIIVDDGSSDQTSAVGLKNSEKFGAEKVRVLTLHHNRGKGGAVRLGVLSSRGKQILFVDADGASKFSDLDKLELSMNTLKETAKEKAKENKKVRKQGKMAIVCGSRAHLEKDSIAKRSLFRTFLMYGFHFVVTLLCVRGVRDTQCGFKLLSREAAIFLFSNMHVERWAFDVDLLYLAQYFGVAISEVAIEWQEIEGTKMVPVWSWLQMGRDIVLIRLRYSLGIWKTKTKF